MPPGDPDGAGRGRKTRLAIGCASLLSERFEAGVRFVELSGLREPGLLAQAVGDVFGLPDHAPEAALDALVNYLSGRRVLLVLDTCEHLLDGCALLAEVLLRNAPGLRVMATSRRPLDIAGSTPWSSRRWPSRRRHRQSPKPSRRLRGQRPGPTRRVPAQGPPGEFGPSEGSRAGGPPLRATP